MMGVLLAASLAAAAPQCPHDRVALLAQSVKEFDRTPGKGWRILGERPGCERPGAELIAAYREAHGRTLSVDSRQGLEWHEGQLRAAIGETARAAALMEIARANDAQLADKLYARATVAFLRRDRAALERARAELAALPQPVAFAEAAARAKTQHGIDVRWPPNLDVVDGLIACYDKPYADAYGCEPPEALTPAQRSAQ